MATTWQGAIAPWLPPAFHAQISEGRDPSLSSEIRRSGDRFVYSVAMLGRPAVTLPIEIMMGGQRHGLGFLSRVEQLDGIPLERSALIQARYAWSVSQNQLVLAPGCSAEKPRSYQTAFGLVLSPTYENKCLVCHGKPDTLGAGKDGGVRCESCHGPGWQHLQAVSKGTPRTGIVNPRNLSPDESIAICAQCHVGLTRFSDPSPDDLLVANQVLALKNSECFIQSGKALACTTCHDPHKNTADDLKTSIKACLGCHSTVARRRAAICPVNAVDACLGCHMPSVEMGPFHLVDHQIRVHPEQALKPPKNNEALRSEVRPLRMFLRIVVTKKRDEAEKASQRLANGETFSRVARDLSSATALVGGYMGAKWLSELDPAVAATALTLRYGQTSEIIAGGERWMILQRLPRDFKWQAAQLEQQAEALALSGDRAAALEKSQQALMIYPHFLRALTFLARTFVETGNPQRAADVLRVATALYPNDSGAEFELARVLNQLGHEAEAIEAYRRVIVLDPDRVSAYSDLGAALYANEDLQGAIDAFREGLQVDPLSAELYYRLSQALARQGKSSAAKQARALATRIDPDLIKPGQQQ